MSTYSYLKTDIINTIENDSTEFSDQISYFVKRAEDRIMKELDDVALDIYTTITLLIFCSVMTRRCSFFAFKAHLNTHPLSRQAVCKDIEEFASVNCDQIHQPMLLSHVRMFSSDDSQMFFSMCDFHSCLSD